MLEKAIASGEAGYVGYGTKRRGQSTFDMSRGFLQIASGWPRCSKHPAQEFWPAKMERHTLGPGLRKMRSNATVLAWPTESSKHCLGGWRQALHCLNAEGAHERA